MRSATTKSNLETLARRHSFQAMLHLFQRFTSHRLLHSPIFQALQAVALIALLSLAGAVIMANVWEFVGWLRTFGIEGALIDKADAVRRAIALETHVAQGVPFQISEEIINWYSRTFVGNARFGSGLGLFAGAFIALSYLKERSTFVKVVAGLFAGALIGARFCLLISSKLVPFLFFVCAGALLVAAFMSIKDEKLPRLNSSTSIPQV